jgi:alpha-beta hydrolase superfamily lysophospholipase
VLSLFGGAAILVFAYHWTYSTSGFLVTGLGLLLLLDRYALRLLPWAGPPTWITGRCVRLGWVALGAVALCLVRPGVPVQEAVLLGIGLSLVVLALEWLIGLLARMAGRRDWPAALTLAVVGLLVPLGVLHPPHSVPKRTPADWGLAFEEVRFEAPDGLQLGGWLVPHPQARGNVIFCHGHAGNRGQVASLLPTLHDLGLNVLAFDFRGHGDSPGHTATFGHREVQDLLAAAAYLRERFPGQPLLIIGVSYGAAVTLQALPHLPGLAGVWSEGSFSRMNHLIENKFRLVPDCVRGGLVSLYDALGWLDCGFWGQDINPVEGLAGVRVPVYFCHAREDRVVPFAEGQALYQAYAGPKWCWWVEDAAHHNIRQRHRDEYLRRLRAFVEDRLAGAIVTSAVPADPPPRPAAGP